MPPKSKKSQSPPVSLLPISVNPMYANHAQVTLTNNELVLDFYYLSPDPAIITGKTHSRSKEAIALHVQRTVAPLSLAKGLATAIANVVAVFEAEKSTTIPTTRTRMPEDKITIWEDNTSELKEEP